jgi:hypothetical protein
MHFDLIELDKHAAGVYLRVLRLGGVLEKLAPNGFFGLIV